MNSANEKPEGRRLLQVFNQYLEPGGEEEWVNQMLKLGGDAFTVKDLRFHSGAWMGRAAPNRLRQATLLWNNPQSRARLRDQVRLHSPDALLFHNLLPVASFGLYEEARELGIPVIQYVHNYRPFSPSGTMWIRDRVASGALRGNPWPEVFGRGWERSFFKTFLLAVQQKRLVNGGHLDVVGKWIAVSEFMRERFIDAGMPADKVVTLRHCWTTKSVGEGIKEGKHYLFLGRLVPEKGVTTLLDAWKILEKRLGSACPHLVIAGTGPEEAYAHARSNRLRKVSCIGFVSGERKRDLLLKCRGLVAPSIWWEPLGLIVHEAYDACRPVLAARSGGLTETVIDGETGFLHEPGNAEFLAESVEKLESVGVEGRAELGMAGRKWLEKNASPTEWRKKFVRIVEDTISGR